MSVEKSLPRLWLETIVCLASSVACVIYLSWNWDLLVVRLFDVELKPAKGVVVDKYTRRGKHGRACYLRFRSSTDKNCQGVAHVQSHIYKAMEKGQEIDIHTWRDHCYFKDDLRRRGNVWMYGQIGAFVFSVFLLAYALFDFSRILRHGK